MPTADQNRPHGMGGSPTTCQLGADRSKDNDTNYSPKKWRGRSAIVHGRRVNKSDRDGEVHGQGHDIAERRCWGIWRVEEWPVTSIGLESRWGKRTRAHARRIPLLFSLAYRAAYSKWYFAGGSPVCQVWRTWRVLALRPFPCLGLLTVHIRVLDNLFQGVGKKELSAWIAASEDDWLA